MKNERVMKEYWNGQNDAGFSVVFTNEMNRH